MKECEMCQPVRCRKCGRTTWAGCGQHVAQVKARVPADQWCAGHPKESAAPGVDGAKPGLLARIFGR